ncbi:hypothetical protein RU639_003126 [Aspergillus parasiticus]
MIQGSLNAHLVLRKATKKCISMAWYCSGSTNAELVDNLFKAGLVKNERVKTAMLGVDRAHYAPSRPYSDSPQPIGYGATISAPHMHGHAYSSIPDELNGHVIGIDHIPELVDLANKNMHKSDQGAKLLDTGKVKFITADGRLGWHDGAPYDAIHVGAAAEKLHPVLIAQLHAPGRMFIPVDTECDGSPLGFGGGQYIWVVDKREDGSVHKEKVFQVSYVPLTDPPKK